MLTFKKILCPVDFSEASYQSLRQAVELASHGPTELHVVHVAPGTGDLGKLEELQPNAHTESERLADIVATLRTVIEEMVPEKVRSQPVLRYGEAAKEILVTAREIHADLIVLSAHGGGRTEGGLDGALGSVAAAVLASASCPVLTLPSGNPPQPDPVTLLNLDRSDIPPAAFATSTNHKLFTDGD